MISFARLVGDFDQAINASRVGSCFDFVFYSLLCMRIVRGSGVVQVGRPSMVSVTFVAQLALHCLVSCYQTSRVTCIAIENATNSAASVSAILSL